MEEPFAGRTVISSEKGLYSTGKFLGRTTDCGPQVPSRATTSAPASETLNDNVASLRIGFRLLVSIGC